MIRYLVSESLAPLSPVPEGFLPDTYQTGIQMLPQTRVHWLRKQTTLSSGLLAPHWVLALPSLFPSRDRQRSGTIPSFPSGTTLEGTQPQPASGRSMVRQKKKKKLFSKGIHNSSECCIRPVATGQS